MPLSWNEIKDRLQPFLSETKRIEFLFELYDKYSAGLFGREKKKRNKIS